MTEFNLSKNVHYPNECAVCKIKIEAPPYSYVRCSHCSCVMVESSLNKRLKPCREEILTKVGKCSKEMGKC